MIYKLFILTVLIVVSIVSCEGSDSAAAAGDGRRLNFVVNLWDNLVDRVSSFLGFGSGGDNDYVLDNEYMIQGGDDGDGDDDAFGNAVDWGSDGAWQKWLSVILNSGVVDTLLDGLGDGEFNVGGLLDLGDNFDFLGDINFNELDFDDPVCSLVEIGIGMSTGFALKASCDCFGSFQSGVSVNCAFDQCAFGKSVCGNVDLGFEFGRDGKVQVNACADFSVDDYEDICFSYILDFRNLKNDAQNCEASYGGNPCACSIDDTFCLSVDCTPFLPGGTMDTCQMLSMVGVDDITNWIPNFDAFRPDEDEITNPVNIMPSISTNMNSNSDIKVLENTGSVPSYLLPYGGN